MPDAEKSFLAIGTPSDSYTAGFSITKTLGEADAFFFARRNKTAKIANSQTQTSIEPSDTLSESELEEHQVANLLLQYVNSVFSFYSLISVGTTMKAPLLNDFVEQRLVKTANNTLVLVKHEEDGVVFEVDSAGMAVLERTLSSFWALERGLSALPNAAFLSIVATFDSSFAEIVEFFLKVHPERFYTDTQLISLKDIIRCGSVEAVVSQVVKDQIFVLMRGSHDDQSEFIANRMDVDIKGSWPRYGDFIELFERRNLIAHGEAYFTLRYEQKLSSFTNLENKGEVGERVTVNSRYLSNVADLLLEYGVLLVFSLWRKYLKQSEKESYAWVNIVAIKAIVEGRSRAVSRILRYMLTIKSSSFSDSARKMAIVNLATSLYKLKQNKEAEKVLKSADWSAVSLDFTVCIAAIRSDVDKVVSMMAAAVQSDALIANSFREWPAFDFIRNDERFRAKYQEIFGEPLIPSRGKNSQNDAADKEGSPEL